MYEIIKPFIILAVLVNCLVRGGWGANTSVNCGQGDLHGTGQRHLVGGWVSGLGGWVVGWVRLVG